MLKYHTQKSSTGTHKDSGRLMEVGSLSDHSLILCSYIVPEMILQFGFGGKLYYWKKVTHLCY